MPGTAEDFGLSFVILSLVFAAAALIRRWSRPLRALFLPTAVIGGFLALALGPEGVGRFTGGDGIFSSATFSMWKLLPGLLINVMCATLLLGERLPSLKTVWEISGAHVIFASIMSAGQFAVGSILVWLVATPVFGFNPKAGALIELSFAGGHGTLAGLTPVLVAHGAGELLEVGLGLATIGMVTGIVIGTMLLNYAIRSKSIPVVRQQPTSPDEDLDIDHHLPGPDDKPLDEYRGMTQVTAAAVFIGVAIAVGIVLLQLARVVFAALGSDFFEKFPLFPFTILGGVLVQLCAVRFKFEWAVNRLAVEGLGGMAIDGIVICAIGTLSLAALGENIGPLLLLAVASVAWSIFMVLVLAPRVFPENWFEHSLAEFGESQGNVATGFVMIDMADPTRRTDVVRAYSYRQLITRPALGGGFLSALSVPLIASWGLPVFAVVMLVATVVLAIWGMRRRSRGRDEGCRARSAYQLTMVPRHDRMEVQTDAGHLWDLRRGDFDDNRSSPRGRGWRALAVSAALEFNFLTAAVAFIWLIVVPAVLVGLAAPVVMALVHWKLGILTLLTSKPARALISLAVVSGVVLWSARPLVAMALDNFWHLHHTLVFPLFVALRELISMGLERLARGRLDPEQLHQRRRAGTVAAAALVAGGGLLLITTFQYSSDAPLSGLRRADLGAFAGAALGNAAVVLGLSTIVASLFWFWREITAAIPVFDWAPAAHPVAARTIRIAHLSDLHLLGERYGYRMETGTKGPCGNGRVADALCRLDAIRATQPLDLIVVSGDITDAGTRSEWVEFLGEVRRQPGLRGRLLFPATTTSTSSTARTQAGWTCRGA